MRRVHLKPNPLSTPVALTRGLWYDLHMSQATIAKPKTSKKAAAKRTGGAAFVLGRVAFKRISAVEGIVVSRHLDADLEAMAGATPERRRAVLAAKYGKC